MADRRPNIGRLRPLLGKRVWLPYDLRKTDIRVEKIKDDVAHLPDEFLWFTSKIVQIFLNFFLSVIRIALGV
jgi:hypothetical protein